MLTLTDAIQRYLTVKRASPRTIQSYRNGLNAFCQTLRAGRRLPDGSRQSLDPDQTPAAPRYGICRLALLRRRGQPQ